MSGPCREIRRWVERTVTEPVEEWVERQEERCRQEECNWWLLCLNKLVCWIVTVTVRVVVWVTRTIVEPVTETVCDFVRNPWAIVGAIIGVIIGLIFATLVILLLGLGGIVALLIITIFAVIGALVGAMFGELLGGLIKDFFLGLGCERTQPTSQWLPRIHFSPENGWLNDPNGLIFANGQYHLFFQHIPHTLEHDCKYFSFVSNVKNVHWGHAVSKNLLDWDHLPVALSPDRNLEVVPFSGSAVLENPGADPNDLSNRIVLVFTHHKYPLYKLDQRQCLAFSTDSNDFELYPNNPVLNRGPYDFNFRDPKVFQFTPENGGELFWAMTLAGGDDVLFYKSRDLFNWEELIPHKVYTSLAFDEFVECPELLQVPERNSDSKHWVLMFSRGRFPGTNPTGADYLVGEFDGREFSRLENQPMIQPIDFGPDFYATQSWFNLPPTRNRSVIIAWMNNWQYAQEIPTSPWRGQFCIPRELSLVNINGILKLCQWPIPELDQRRVRLASITNPLLEPDSRIPVQNIAETVMDIVAVIEVEKALAVGISVRVGNNQRTDIFWDSETASVVVDRRNSGIIDLPGGRYFAPFALNNGTLHLRIIVDQSSVEVFAGDGEVVISALIFPDISSNGVELFVRGNNPARLVSLEVFSLQ